jgi:hypothetical protein
MALQNLLKAMEMKELHQLDGNIAKLQRTLKHQSEEVTKQDDLVHLKFIASDVARQELEISMYQNRLFQYPLFHLPSLSILLRQ